MPGHDQPDVAGKNRTVGTFNLPGTQRVLAVQEGFDPIPGQDTWDERRRMVG